jgi:molecular chaperone Hsp33
MDKIIRCITSDGAIMASAIDASDIVFTAKKLHHLSRSATAALGRLLCATSIMGAMLKQKDATINLRVMGDGPIGPVIAVGDSKGNVRGYVGNADCPTEYYNNGKINVSKAVGKNGVLNVMRDYGSGDPYIGQVELVSGEIAEDITSYYATSEQIPTVCALGVLIDKDYKCISAGGYMIQLLPGTEDAFIDKLEQRISVVPPVSTLFSTGKTNAEYIKDILGDIEFDVFDEADVSYYCDCTKQRVENALISMGEKDMTEIIEEGKDIDVSCQFCDKIYTFTPDDLRNLLKKAKK